MYRWYKNSAVCYAFLSDITANINIDDSEATSGARKNSLTHSLWFTRGWTLQELLAPINLVFFDRYWAPLGSKISHSTDISEQTGIPTDALKQFVPNEYCIAHKMAWAADRRTTRLEDRAYSLLGLFGINMPLLYGEGERAFSRLQEELIKTFNDISIFAWSGIGDPSFGVLASSPDCFQKTPKDVSFLRDINNDVILSKSGVEGKFWLHHYSLDIYVVKLENSFSFSKSNIFIQRSSEDEKCYHRVAVDGEYLVPCGTFPFMSSLGEWHSIRITREPIREVSSISISSSWPIMPRAYRGVSTLVPGHFVAPDNVRAFSKPAFRKVLFMQKHPINFLPMAHLHSECLCIFNSNSYRSTISPLANIVLHLGYDSHKRPVLLISPLLQKDRRQPWHYSFTGNCSYKGGIHGLCTTRSSPNGLLANIFTHALHRARRPFIDLPSDDSSIRKAYSRMIPAIADTVASAGTRIVSVGDFLKVHFFEQESGWEVRFEICDCLLAYSRISAIPNGWLLPANKRGRRFNYNA